MSLEDKKNWNPLKSISKQILGICSLCFRLKNPSGNEVFKINPINYQPAATEISDESDLEPIFEAVGRNARMPVGVRDATAHDMCKAYVSSAHAYCSSILLVLFASLLFLIY